MSPRDWGADTPLSFSEVRRLPCWGGRGRECKNFGSGCAYAKARSCRRDRELPAYRYASKLRPAYWGVGVCP
jgi:hypothetical protein